MRDNQSGAALNVALLGALLLSTAAVCFLMLGDWSFVNWCMLPISLIAVCVTFKIGTKKGALIAAAATGVLIALTLALYTSQWLGLIFWGVWLAFTVNITHWFRVGVNGLISERDYYVKECERVAMTNSVTQMRNMLAYLNDAPIYIKIARRYRLTMVVMVIRLKNAEALRQRLNPVAFNEMLEALSKALRDSIRLEDLAYFVDDGSCVWCMNMFTHVESMDIVVERISNKISNIKPDFGNEEPIPLDFGYGHAVFNEQEDPSPATLLNKAIAATESGAQYPAQ